MSNYRLTRHLKIRAKQRGFKETDIPVIVDVGKQIDDNKFFMSNKNIDREIKKYKQVINALERLRGSTVVMIDETILTVYRTSQRTEKSLLRTKH